MAGYWRVIATIPCGNNIPEDVVQNTWYFESPGAPSPADAPALFDLLEQFYHDIDTYLAAQYGPDCVLTFYDMSQPEPRVPIYEDTATLLMGSGQSLPAEVALCMSYQGDRVAGANQARRRGRLYFGPLDGDYNTTVNFVTRPTSSIITGIRDAGLALMTASAAAGFTWSVYSPTIFASTGELNAAYTEITNGWVDNSFDTQRRRGPDSTTRTTWG